MACRSGIQASIEVVPGVILSPIVLISFFVVGLGMTMSPYPETAFGLSHDHLSTMAVFMTELSWLLVDAGEVSFSFAMAIHLSVSFALDLGV